MFIFTCQIFARWCVFSMPPDNNWPLQKTASGCAPQQTTSNPSKSLTEVVLSWIAFLNGPIRWGDGDIAVILGCDGHMLILYLISSNFSHLFPHPSQKNTTSPSYTSAQVNSPCISVTSPLSIPKEYTHPAQCPGRLSYEWVKGMIMAPCWAFSYLFNF